METGEQRVLLAKMTTDRLVAAVVGLLLCLRGPAAVHASEAPFAALLSELGLETHTVGLEAEDVTDGARLAALTDADLQGLGLKLGARRRVQSWAAARASDETCKPAPVPAPAARQSEVLATTTSLDGEYEHCVVGAGPGGLQLGKLMMDSGATSFVIFESAAHAGNTPPLISCLLATRNAFLQQTLSVRGC